MFLTVLGLLAELGTQPAPGHTPRSLRATECGLTEPWPGTPAGFRAACFLPHPVPFPALDLPSPTPPPKPLAPCPLHLPPSCPKEQEVKIRGAGGVRTKADPERGKGGWSEEARVGGPPCLGGLGWARAWPGDLGRHEEGDCRVGRLLGVGIRPLGLGPRRGSSYLRGEAPGPGGGGGSGCGARAAPRLLHHNIPRPGARRPRGRAPSGGDARGRGRGAILGQARAREPLWGCTCCSFPGAPPCKTRGPR